MRMMEANISAAWERLRAARSVCVLTGSGISAESGLPTFRGIGGLWRSHRVEDLASPEGFARDPKLVWSWYHERRAAHRAALPNAAHRALAQLEDRIPDFTLATQNVDSLHMRAGSRSVLELHGHLREARCTGCDERRSLEDGLPFAAIDHHCGGRFRPDIVWFGEALPTVPWDRAIRAAQRAEVVLIVGTSGLVNPAAALCTHYAPQAYKIEVNLEATAITPAVDLSLLGSATDLVPRLCNSAAPAARVVP